MKLKTIKKTIITKLEDWLSSITDEQLRKDVKDNLLLSGGSIVSMLLKEPVNDYDIYIKDMGVLIRLAEYYTAPDLVLDGRKRNEYIKDYIVSKNLGFWGTVETFLAESGDDSEKLVRYRTLKENQVKLDIPSEGINGEDFYKNKKAGISETPYRVAFLSPNAISLTDDIQIVLRFHGTAEEIHKTFDFIHATNYFTFKEGLVLNNDALVSILTKELKYQGSYYPLTSIIRMKKFLNRGWNITAGEMLKIMFQISELDLTNVDVLEEQLIGVDIAYFSTLVEILRNSKNKNWDYSYLESIIEKVFNNG